MKVKGRRREKEERRRGANLKRMRRMLTI